MTGKRWRMKWMILSLLGLLAGCGGELPYTDASRDPEAYAASVKKLVLGNIAAARTSKEPADQLAPIVAELENNPKRPKGGYAETYEQLLTSSRQLLEECQRMDGRPKDLDSRLTKLAALADSLPGSVSIAPASN